MRCREFGLVHRFALLVALLASPAGQAGDAVDGREIYNFRCYFCHGYSGDGKTLAAEMLAPRPRDFTGQSMQSLTREAMIDAVTNGRPGTAMKPFSSLLSEHEVAAVVDFVRDEFMTRGAENTRYHTVENGWPGHQRFAAAFPFVRGEIALSIDTQELTPEQRAGRSLYLASCVSCHDFARRPDHPPAWEAEAVSYPRTGFATGDFLEPADAVSGATTFARHEQPPVLTGATQQELQGGELFQQNCAFCHAADGTGKNWIGTFMIPHPRDLTSPAQMAGMTRTRLYRVIRDGLPGTSMPAWGNVLADHEIHSVIAYIGKVFHPLPDGP